MPVKILSRSTASPFGGTNNYLVGNVGDWLRTTIEFEAGFYFKTTNTDGVTLTYDGIIQRNSGSWIDEGFEIGDSVTVELKYYLISSALSVTVTQTRTIDDLTDNEMTLNATVGSFNYDVNYPSSVVGGNTDITALSLEVKTDKAPSEIELQYNQFPNADISTAPQTSIIDGNKNVFIRQSVDGTLSTMTEVGNKSGGAITTAQCRYVSKTDVWYKYEIVINHSIWGYFDTLGNFLPNLNAPDYYDGAECLTDSYRLFVRKNNNDPNVVLTNDLDQPLMQKLGNTGYYEENFNGQPNNYEIISSQWEDTSGNGINGLAYNQNSVLKLTIQDANSNFDSTTSEFSFFICYVPQDDADFKGLNTPFQDNVIMNNLGIDFTFTPQVHSASPIVATLLGFTSPNGSKLDVVKRHFEVVSANTLEVTLEFSPNASLQTFMESKDAFNRKWVYGLSVGTDETNVANSDRVRLYGLTDAEEVITPLGSFDDLDFDYANWDGESVPSPLAKPIQAQPHDDIQAIGTLLLDWSSSQPDLVKIESVVELVETSTGNTAELDSTEIDVSGAVTNPNIQQINETGQRGFNYPINFKREQSSITRNASLDIGTKAGYDILFPFRMRYEKWINRANLPSAMYDASEPNNGFNNFWEWLDSGGGAGSGYSLQHSILLHFDNGDVYKNSNSITSFDYYEQKEDTHRIRHFSEDKTTNLLINTDSYTNVGGVSYVVNNNAILQGNNTRVSALFKSLNICQNVIFAEITLEVNEGAGFKSVWKMRTDQNPVAANNPLQPLTGQSNLLITYPNANEIEVECLINPNLIPQGANYLLTSQIKTSDSCGCDEIDIVITGGDFGTISTTIQGDGNFEDASGLWRIEFKSPDLWEIKYFVDGVWVFIASYRDADPCPSFLNWTITPEGEGYGITNIDTEKPTCECVQYTERILGYGVGVVTPQPDQEPREKINCCPTLPVFADLTSNDPYRNDWNGWCYAKKELSNWDINFKLQHCETGDIYDLDDSTYGVFYDYGSLPVGSDYRAYYLDWQKVLATIGEGTYRLVRVTTAFGSDTNNYSCKYKLKHYNSDSANKTVRVETIMSGLIEDTGLDYTNVNWKHSIRFKGYFGKEQPTYEIDEVIMKDDEVKPIKADLVSEYELRGDIVSDCVTKEMINYHLKANNIYISDYNRLNHRNDYRGYKVRFSSADEFRYLSQAREANFVITFKDSKENRRKSNCGVDDIFPASGAPVFETIVCDDATVQLNGATVGTITSGATGNFPVIQDGSPVGSWDGSNWVVPVCPQDLFLYLDYKAGDDTVSVVIDTNSVGTITSANTTGLTSVVYTINGVGATLPLTLADTDTLGITFDPAGADGQIILTGTY